MIVNQISIFLENRPGRLDDVAKVFAKNNIDIVTISIADTKEFGILRVITRDNKLALESLKKEGFIVTSNSLIGVEVNDKPGEFAVVLGYLHNENISIEYLYSFTKKDGKSIIIFKPDDANKAIEILKSNGFDMNDSTII